MRVEQITDRGRLLTFEDDISLYLITGTHVHLLCDTHLGSDSMDQVRKILSTDPIKRDLIIFNSHSDWDHIWGNGVFAEHIIIGHELCRKRMYERGVFDLTQNVAEQRGNVVITLPNLTFSDRLTFEDEEISFSHAPGHTVDSSVCYDIHDQVLYLGDLVEDPIPYLDAYDLDQYITTLTMLLDHPARILVSAHSGLVTRDLVRENIKYIQAIRDGTLIDEGRLGSYQKVHNWNLNMRIVHQEARKIPPSHTKKGESILVDLLQQAGDLHEQDPENLKYLLMVYVNG
jgi:cyclase